jgi:hypothetical protein
MGFQPRETAPVMFHAPTPLLDPTGWFLTAADAA